MDTNSYIETGILEQYVLNNVSEQERREVECLSKIYPEIKEALVQAENDLEQMALSGAVKAPAGLKEDIMSKLENIEQLPAEGEEKAEEDTPKVVPFQNEKPTTWPVVWAAAASISILIALWQFMGKEDLQKELADSKEEQEQLLANNEYLRGELDFLTEDVQQTFDPTFKKVVLDPTESFEGASLSMIWQPESGLVKISMDNLPELSPEEQYQLWVWKDGVPADMGVLPKDFSDIYLASKLAMEGDAFAITIEPLGGLPDPSLDRIAFYGNV